VKREGKYKKYYWYLYPDFGYYICSVWIDGKENKIYGDTLKEMKNKVDKFITDNNLL